MSTVQQFLKTKDRGKPKTGQLGKHSDWLLLHKLKLEGGALQFVATMQLGLRGKNEHECVEIPAKPGTYVVQCRAARFGNDTRISALRAFPEGMLTKRGEKLKEIPVDCGGIAVVNIDVVHASMNENEERTEWFDDVIYHSGTVEVAKWKPTKTDIPHVDSGFGDGCYPVFELLSGRKAVGLEFVFIEEDATYPF